MYVKRLPIAERLEAYSMPEPNSGCVLWTGDTNQSGYGRFRDDERRIVLAHRASWMHHRGPIPADIFVCHKCDVPACINPQHLFLGTNQDNLADMVAKGRNKAVPVRGEANYRSLLTNEQVLAIRADRRGRTVIARHYGVTAGCIHAIQTRRNWRHI